MQTLKFKIKHECQQRILQYQRQYSIVLHTCFNHLNKNMQNNKLGSLFDYKVLSSQLMKKLKALNHIQLLQVWLVQCALSEAYQLVKSYKYWIEDYNDKMQRKQELLNKHSRTKKQKKQLRKLFKVHYPKVIFGGKALFNQRCNNEISKQQFKQNKLSPLYSIGMNAAFANKLFRIKEDLQTVIFQPKHTQKYQLKLVGLTAGYKKLLNKLYNLQQLKQIPITYKLTKDYIYISFEEAQVYKDQFNFTKIHDRYCSLDLNPNYIGYSIIDWKSSNQFKIIDSGVYSFKQLNDLFYTRKGTDSSDKVKKYLTNKRNYEIIEVAKNLINKCCYYKVENFIVEDLNMKSKDKQKGKDYNRLCNNTWIRNKFLNNIQKRCKIFNINYLEVQPQYSSFTGNILFRSLNLPDQVLSSVELSRRGYQFRHQYVLKDKEQIKNIIRVDINNDKVFKELFIKSMEEFNISANFKNIIQCYYYFKANFENQCYRVSLENFSSSFRQFLNKSSRINRFSSSIL